MLTADYLRSVLDYNQETGEFRWRTRTDVGARWNGRWAGSTAGGLHVEGYRVIAIFAVQYRAARLAFLHVTGTDVPDGMEMDHINGKPGDDRWVNLRLATRQQQQRNRSSFRGRMKGVKPVPSGRFQVQISGRYLGTFDTAEQAHEAYCDAASFLYGEFARAA